MGQNGFFTVLGLYIFFGSMLALLQAIVSFSIHNKKSTNHLHCSALFLISLLMLEHYITMYLKIPFTVEYFSIPTLILYFIKFLKMIVGPVLFLYIESVLNLKYKYKKRYLLHLLPGIAIEIYVVFSYIIITTYDSSPSIFYYIETLHILAIFHGLVYISITLIKILSIWKNFPKELFQRFIYVFVISFVLFLSMIIVSLNIFWGKPIIETTAPILICTLIIMIYIVEKKYPDLIESYNKEIKKARYKKSNINHIDKASIEIRLKELMEEDKLYCDEDLSLAALAEQLMITSHQLSEFLNTMMNQSFKKYINSYRVNEVKDMLIKHPDRSITHIAFAAGFNSMSAMYTLFSSDTGYSPREYRKLKLE